MGFTPRSAMVTILLMSACFSVFNLLAAHRMDNTLVFITDILVWTLLNVWFDRRIGRRDRKNVPEE